MELAALAFPAHPAVLRLVPRSPAVEQQESGTPSGSLAVALVEPVDAHRRHSEQFVVAGHVLGRCVEPVGEQREPHISLGVAEVVNLQRTDQRLDIVSRW